MRFLAIDRLAAEQLISERMFQSGEYQQGRALGSFLIGQVKSFQLGPKISLAFAGEGAYLLYSLESTNDLLIFDFDAAPIFDNLNFSDALYIFQRALRFAVKIWKNLKLSVSEHVIANSTKAAIFPFPITQKTSYRITLDRNPDKKRTNKRPALGNCLLVFQHGYDEGGGPLIEPSVTIFRKATSNLSAARDQSKQNATVEKEAIEKAKITSLNITTLHFNPLTAIAGQLGFDTWLHYLTENQTAFVQAKLTAPHRIEGPAGTGKTLCLVLKCIATLRNAEDEGVEHHCLFIAHSEATRKTIQELFDTNDERAFSSKDRNMSLQSVKVSTLQSLCAELLRTEISEIEFLDRDAFESKMAQLLYANEALEETLGAVETHKHFLSEKFYRYLCAEDHWVISQMLQHEISVVIKGRAEEDLSKYRKLQRLRYGLPLENDSDKGFVFLMFQNYQKRLRAAGQFDTDDVVLSANGQLNTPIWRRRRASEGFDSIFIDETHLFNLNELSIFHRLTRKDSSFPIAYSVDQSQSVGDRGWSDANLLEEALDGEMPQEKFTKTLVKSIFRCSPDIVNLAFSVTSAGATLFTNFQDPMKIAASAFTQDEERKCAPSVYLFYASDDEMVADAYARADKMAQEMNVQRADIAIIGFSDEIFHLLKRFAENGHKPVEIISRRGDIESVNRAHQAGRVLLSSPDFVGGLEFAGVILVGVDSGRVPPMHTQETIDSSNFLNYASHSRLYVAITRAKYRIEVLGAAERGPTPIFKPAIDSGLIEVKAAS